MFKGQLISQRIRQRIRQKIHQKICQKIHQNSSKPQITQNNSDTKVRSFYEDSFAIFVSFKIVVQSKQKVPQF